MAKAQLLYSIVGGHFDVMNKKVLFIGVLFTFLSCSTGSMEDNNPVEIDIITFTFDNDPTYSFEEVSETIDGITVTVSNGSLNLRNIGGTDGSSGNVVISNNLQSSITFSFNKPVMVSSILALSGNNIAIEYTFTPAGGNNSAVTKFLNEGDEVATASVNLNWTYVTSFTVTSRLSLYGFDNLKVIDPATL